MLIDQITEGLFDYDQNKTSNPIVPNLALNGTWSPDHLNFTCNLRTNVKFHDGTPFNATAVQWNFDRIYRFIDTMPYDNIWVWYYLYLNSEGKPIINHTEIVNDFTIKFVLNQPYAPIRDLLAVWSSYILSPSSTPENEFIDLETGTLIGTGPFILDSCELNIWGECEKTEMHANPDYWGGKPLISKVIFLHPGSTERMERMLSGELSYTVGPRDNEILDIYRNTTGITVVPKISSIVWYLLMNNKVINVTMRRAISYAFNYTWYLEDFRGGHSERAKSPLPKMMRYSNWEDFNIPYYNISVARQILKDSNWSGTAGLPINDNITAGNPWEVLVDSETPLATYNFSIIWKTRSEYVANRLAYDLKQIGVKINVINMTTYEWWNELITGKLVFCIAGWAPSLNDPVDMINPLYSSKADGTEGNIFHFNDTLVQQWMEQALQEFDETARELLYYNIQQRLIEDLNPLVWLDSDIKYHIWDSQVRGIPMEGIALKFILKYAYFI
jgi:peptide/nickel transport system substrate-binding protein